MEPQRLDPQETREARRLAQEAVIRASLVDMPSPAHLNSLSSPFASCRIGVPKPSVNQP
jgi:hypothetical protein